ncbi:P-loop containing nucleoside triphosphate hydrolase protein [Ramicandelaber brevisporus]|nr:P-loop containing nucleoside triphosphate hydrolase protein [Ramicandelaber brevisporus]
MGISPVLAERLEMRGLQSPLPAQSLMMPHLLLGTSAACLAEAGSGKTLGYLLPMMTRLLTMRDSGMLPKYTADGTPAGPAGIIIVPTKELAWQVANVIREVGSPDFMPITETAYLYTLDSARSVKTPLLMTLQRYYPDMVVLRSKGAHAPAATLQERFLLLQDWLTDEEKTSLATLDKELSKAKNSSSKSKSKGKSKPTATATATATASESVNEDEPIQNNAETDSRVELLSKLEDEARKRALVSQINSLAKLDASERGSIVLVFANKTADAQRYFSTVSKAASEHSASLAAPILFHSDIGAKERSDALNHLLRRASSADSHLTTIVVATDVLARGIDLPGVKYVIQADFADNAPQYLHRAGRTSRAGREGTLVNLVGERDKPLANAIRVSTMRSVGSTTTKGPLTEAFGNKGAFGRRKHRYADLDPETEAPTSSLTPAEPTETSASAPKDESSRDRRMQTVADIIAARQALRSGLSSPPEPLPQKKVYSSQ